MIRLLLGLDCVQKALAESQGGAVGANGALAGGMAVAS